MKNVIRWCIFTLISLKWKDIPLRKSQKQIFNQVDQGVRKAVPIYRMDESGLLYYILMNECKFAFCLQSGNIGASTSPALPSSQHHRTKSSPFPFPVQTTAANPPDSKKIHPLSTILALRWITVDHIKFCLNFYCIALRTKITFVRFNHFHNPIRKDKIQLYD